MHTAKFFACATAFLGAVDAHIKLSQPVPYDKSTLKLDPLKNVKPGSSGSDYPCQQQTYQITTMNEMKVGDSQPLAFDGSASHGGGSCQIAVTLDEKPTASSVFKLIHVFQGGCPTTADGNGGTNNYTFTIPEGFPNGKATLAWSWYNRIGNREFYMNCAPIDVTGGSDSKEFYDSLPNQYVINLPTSECSSVEGPDLEIPNPGKFVTKAGSRPSSAPQGPGCAAAAAAMQSGGSAGSDSGYQSPSPSPTSSAPSSSSPAPSPDNASSPEASSPSQANSSSSYPTLNPSSGTSISPNDSSPGPIVSSVPTTGKAPAYNGNQGSSSGANDSGNSSNTAPVPMPAPSGSSDSTSSGAVLECNGENQFGLVNPNAKIVWQNVAAGTKCVNGAIQKRRAVLVRRHAKEIRLLV